MEKTRIRIIKKLKNTQKVSAVPPQGSKVAKSDHFKISRNIDVWILENRERHRFEKRFSDGMILGWKAGQ